PRWPLSGLPGTTPFEGNYLDGRSVVHPRSLGYVVNPADLFLSSSGTVMLPYPLNRGATPIQSYTWRDTSVQAKAGPNGVGVPLDIEVGPPLNLESQVGELAPAGA